MQLAFVPPAASPIRRQYLTLKQQHADAILFFQLGDFYETFEDDARTVARVCDIALTSREMGRGERLPMAGVPVHAADVYIGRLVERGFHIAIAEQREAADAHTPASSLVKREITRVITPGTLVDPELLKATRPNYLAAVALGPRGVGIAHADISTASFACVEIAGEDARDVARAELARLQPAECLVVEADAALPLVPEGTSMTADGSLFAPSSVESMLCRHFGVGSIEALGLSNGLAALATAAVLRYIDRTQPRASVVLETLEIYDPRGYMVLDPATRAHLEVTRGATGDRAGSLLETLDETRTPMGARRLSHWTGHPLLARESIEERLDAVGALVSGRAARGELQGLLAELPDLERLASRAAQCLLGPRAALSLAHGLAKAAALPAALGTITSTSALARVIEQIDPPLAVIDEIRATLAEDPPSAFGDGVIRPGHIAELDELRSLSKDGRQWLVELEQRERQRTGLKGLKIGYNRVFGYYLEVSVATLAQPVDYYREEETGARTVSELLDRLGYQRRQTLTSAERFVTPELREHEVKQARSSSRMAELEREAHEQLCARIAEHADRLIRTASAIAELDALASLAQVADERGYARPEIVEDAVTEIVAGRHPVVERVVGWDAYIPSDVRLAPSGCATDEGTGSASVVILTGPNMAGKTTYGRMALLLSLMGQCGSFVPAQRARLGLVDRIFLRSGAGDDIAGGRSTFMVEMTETAAILRGATQRSLIFFDEVGRGTSTYDGMAIARAIVEHLAQPARCCRTIFSTHYHELAAMEAEGAGVRNYRAEVRETANQVAFTYRVIPGSADRSYGVHVARLAGLPPSVTARAAEELRRLEREGHRPPSDAVHREPCVDPSAIVAEELLALDVDTMAPIEALNAIARMQARLRGSENEDVGQR